jgi:hypothetical protein
MHPCMFPALAVQLCMHLDKHQMSLSFNHLHSKLRPVITMTTAANRDDSEGSDNWAVSNSLVSITPLSLRSDVRPQVSGGGLRCVGYLRWILAVAEPSKARSDEHCNCLALLDMLRLLDRSRGTAHIVAVDQWHLSPYQVLQ